MMAAVRKNASADLIAQLDEFASQYDSALQSEESIAELFGLLANNYANLSTANKNVIKRWLDKLAKVLGLKPFTDAEVIDLLNTVSGKVARGEVIAQEDLAIIQSNAEYVSTDEGKIWGSAPERKQVRTKPAPKKTVKAYKMFRVDPKQKGKLFPLFVNANDEVAIGTWLDAEVGELTKEGKVKSKIGNLAYRPGWHMGDLPIATHIGDKYNFDKGAVDASLKKPTARSANHVWAEVEVAADVDWQKEANARASKTKDGKVIPRTAHITDQVPVDGYYRYKTNPNMTGEWLISGSIKVNRVLTDQEVKAINDKAGVADLPRVSPINLSELGFEVTQTEDVTNKIKKETEKRLKSQEIIPEDMTRKQIESLYLSEEKPKIGSTSDIAKFMENWSNENKVFEKDIYQLPDQEVIDRFAKHIELEISAWNRVSGNKYVSFYDEDIKQRTNPILQEYAKKAYGRDLTDSEVKLFHLVSAFASPQATPVFDSSKGFYIFDRYMKTGELSGYSDKIATVWEVNEKGKRVDTGVPRLDKEGKPMRSKVSIAYAQESLDKFNTILNKLNNNIDKAIEWISSKHKFDEISNMIESTPKENEYLSKSDGGYGIFGLTGAKLGSYTLNRFGNYSTVTKDLWYARTMARLSGEKLFDIKTKKAISLPWSESTKKGVRMRSIADAAFQKVADNLNTEPAMIQEMIWDFEKRLYEMLGATESEGYVSDGLKKGIEMIEATNNLSRKQSQNINTIINVARQNNISDDAIKQYLLSQGFTQQQIDDAFNKIPKSIKESQLSKIGESSRQKMKTKGVPLMKRLNDRYNRFIEEALDRQALPKRIMRKAGLANTPTFMVANAGASSHAKRLAEKAYDRTVAGLSNKMITRLEEIIFARRVKAIDTNRAERAADAKDKFDKISDEYNELKKKRIKDRNQEDIDKINEYKKLEDRYNRLKDPIIHPKKYTSEQADIDLEVYRKELGDKDFNDLIKRADNYFDEYKSLLKTMNEEGIIDDDVYEMFAEVDYQPRQFLNHITDINGDLLYDEMYSVQTQSLADKQIQSLQKGSDQDLYMDAFSILESSILSRAHAVFSNRMNKTFAKEYNNRLDEINKLKEKQNPTKNELKEIADFEALQENILMDEITGYTSTGKPEYKLSDAKTLGYKPVYYYENGIKNRIWMKKPFFDKYTDTNNQYLSSVARENIALASGTAAVKTLATGKNPLFFLTNTPRDFMFILAFSPEYSSNVAKSAFQLMRDASKGVRDVVKGTELYDKYIEYGGGMDFLALQGKYKNKGILKSMVDATFDKKTQDRIGKNPISKFLDKFNLASEVGFRMAVFNKSINNQLKELGETNINKLSKEQQDLIYTNAVKQARQLTDFNQGGRAVKALDAGLPYLNAAVQGTRAAASNLKQRPLETTSRIMQITGYSAAMVIGSSIAAIAAFRDDDDEEIKNKKTSEIYFETISAVSQYDLDNYFIIPLGIKDDRANWKYLRIAKSQALTPYLNASEHYIRKAIAEQSNIEYKQDLGETMMRTFETNISPLPLSIKQSAGRIPLFDATMALYGFDSYTGNPLSWDMGKIPEQLEGIVDDRVEPAYKELGKVAGQSPVRLQSAVESFITTPSTNPYIGLTYGLANTAVSLGDTESIVSDLKNIGTQSMKRLIKSTSEYNEVAKAKERMSDEIIDVYRKHIEVEANVRKAVKTAKETGDTEKALEKLNSIYKENPEMLDNIRKWYKSEVGKKRLLPLVSSLRFQEIKEVKAIILADYFGKKLMKSDPDFTEREQKVWDQLKQEKVIDKEVVQFYVNMFQKK